MAYRILFDRHNYLVFDISPHEIKAKYGHPFALQDNPTKLWAEDWKEINATFRDDSDQKTALYPPQITTWFIHELVLSQAAYEAIGDQLKNSCEILPVNCDGTTYWLCHITARLGLDVVDLKNSERTIDITDYIEATKITFLEDKISDLVFKTEYNGFQNIYCTQNFKDLVESYGLKGLIFSTNMATTPE